MASAAAAALAAAREWTAAGAVVGADGRRERAGGGEEAGDSRVAPRRPPHAAAPPSALHRSAAAVLCAAALVVGTALLAADGGGGRAALRTAGGGGGSGGGVSLLQERLSIGLNIARAFEQTRARSEEDEGGQIKVRHAHEKKAVAKQSERPAVAPAPAADADADAHMRATESEKREVDRQTEDSEKWSGKKLRDMVARLFRAVAAMDERMSRSDLQRRRDDARLKAQDVTKSDLLSSQQNVESRIMAAAGQLKTVLAGERTMRHIITQQESVGETEHRQTSKEVEENTAEVRRLKHKLADEQREVQSLRDKAAVHAGGAGDDAVVDTLSALLSASGVQHELDEWCSHNAACPAVSSMVSTRSRTATAALCPPPPFPLFPSLPRVRRAAALAPSNR